MTLTQQIQKPEVRIRQRKGEVYYETSIEKSVSGGWIPFIVEHGITQEEADTKAFRSLLLSARTDERKQVIAECLEAVGRDWNKAVAFRKHPQTIPGRSGWYTLGYFKMPNKV